MPKYTMKFNKSGTRIFAQAATIRRFEKNGRLSPGSTPRKVKGGYIPVHKVKKK